MKRRIFTVLMLALLTPMSLAVTAGPAQADNSVVTLQNGKPKQPAPTPAPKPRKPGPRDEGDGDS
jgi:hypothetical protein